MQIEKDSVVLAEIDRYRMVELADGRFELTLEGITQLPGTGYIADWEMFDVVAIVGHGQIMYTHCRWTKIGESGTLGDMVPTSMTVIAEHRIEQDHLKPEMPEIPPRAGEVDQAWNSGELDLTLTAG